MIEKLLKFKGLLIIAGIIIIFVVLVSIISGRPVQEFTEKYASYDLSGASSGRTNIYNRYMERHAGAAIGRVDIPIDIFEWTSAEGVSLLYNHLYEPVSLRTEEVSFIEYTFNVEQAGFYFIHIEYAPIRSRGIPIERVLFINDEIPFLGADRLMFHRIWGDEGPSRFDNQGNEIRASQMERPQWESAWFRDSLGYATEPYRFYFQEGENTIRLIGVNEPMAIRSLSLRAPVETKSYRDYIAAFDLNNYKNTHNDYLLKIQGERAIRRSDPSLYPIYDRSSGATEPASVAKIRLNMIGGQSWRVAGQWIEWEFEVPEDGMYRISIKGRQNYNRGYVSNRTIMINGEIPCEELASVRFQYNNKWVLTTLGNENGDFYFPLKRGTNTVRIQATLGGLGEMLSVMEESVYRLNAIYRKILVLTGPEPDIYRDYRVDVVYPDVISAMELEAKILYKLVDDLTRYSGERSAQAASTLTLARQLELFVRRPDKIPRTLVNFKANISSLGDSLLALSQSQLDIDYIIVSAEGAELPKINENFFVSAWHEIKSFFASFFVDYDMLGDVHKKSRDVVEVWILTGRDQSSILKAMIDNTFTPNTGIRVNVKLVAPEALMPAVVAGTGPDMVITVPQIDPVNYAIRNAVMDLSKFPGFDEVVSELHPSVVVPFMFRDGVYGLPETQYFHVMFYRKDIFEELDIEIPNTWDDLINILPIIQKNNMNVGIPSVATNVQMNIDFSNFLAHLFQRGGTLYNEDGSRTLLDSEIAIEAFDVYTKFFTHYKTPVVYDFVNRFRTGEMPLAFADYTNFNTLEVFAPELRGLWGFAIMPGIPVRTDEHRRRLAERGRADEPIDRSVSTGTLATMIFTKADRQGRADKAWEFMKWWISSDTQLLFGRELESIMGAAARYPTANYNAFLQLAWGSEQMAILDAQRQWTVGIPEVPGGYFISRHITNAARRILNEGQDTRETLLDYTLTINDELIKKRKEFGLE
ncbi:MAG: extracellular solute-binding protein [Treponema sp.]|nr:extracellular solute-binding protein [Treponema sp.]